MPRVLLLASRSARRAELLQAAGIPFVTGAFPDIDESLPAGPEDGPLDPMRVVRRLALRKAEAAASQAAGRTILTADTLVFRDGCALGKPRDDADAIRMLRSLSGRSHEVATGVALVGPGAGGGVRVLDGAALTTVHFRHLEDAEIAAYVATGEPGDKAGAYALQAGAAGFVSALEGDLDNVIGLPLTLVRRLLEALNKESGAVD